MTTPSDRPSSGLKKIMHLGQVAILSALLLSASAQCSINTTLEVRYIKQGTVTTPTKFAFKTCNDPNNSLDFFITCKKGGQFTKCDSTKSICVTYTCSPVSVKVKGMKYLTQDLGSFTRPSESGKSGDYAIDYYYSCY